MWLDDQERKETEFAKNKFPEVSRWGKHEFEFSWSRGSWSMIVHVFVAQTRIDLTLLWNRKEVVISSYFLHFFCNQQSRQISSHDGISLKYLRIAISSREQAFIELNIRWRRQYLILVSLDIKEKPMLIWHFRDCFRCESTLGERESSQISRI